MILYRDFFSFNFTKFYYNFRATVNFVKVLIYTNGLIFIGMYTRCHKYIVGS